MKLLALDTVTEYCSAALSIKGELIWRETLAKQSHTEMILPMVEALLAEAELSVGELDAIAFDRGPGSFTGLRIGAGVAQGLALASNLPVIPVSSLQLIAQTCMVVSGQNNVMACIDARQGEVYWGCFLKQAGIMQLAGVEKIDHPCNVASGERVYYGAGSGFSTFQHELTSSKQIQLSGYDETIYPFAKNMITLAIDSWEGERYVDASEVLPVYLRDKVAKVPARPPGEKS